LTGTASRNDGCVSATRPWRRRRPRFTADHPSESIETTQIYLHAHLALKEAALRNDDDSAI
jgi:hypothetical protein